MVVRFEVPGEPVGKGRPRITKNGHAYTPAKTREYEARMREAYQQDAKGFVFEGPVRVTIDVFFAIPKSTPQYKVGMMLSDDIRPVKKPDLDNIIKTIDALNGVAWHDDAAVVEIEARKSYDIRPRVEIEIKNV